MYTCNMLPIQSKISKYFNCSLDVRKKLKNIQ